MAELNSRNCLLLISLMWWNGARSELSYGGSASLWWSDGDFLKIAAFSSSVKLTAEGQPTLFLACCVNNSNHKRVAIKCTAHAHATVQAGLAQRLRLGGSYLGTEWWRALSAAAFSHVRICMGDSAAAQITARCQSTSGETAVSAELRELSLPCHSDGAGQQARGCKVILLIIQQAAVRCKEKTKKKKKPGLCPKSPRRCCLLIHGGVSVSQSVLSKIPTLS